MGFSFPFPVRFPPPLAFFRPGRFLLPDFVFGMIPASELPLSRRMGSGWGKTIPEKGGRPQVPFWVLSKFVERQRADLFEMSGDVSLS